MTEAIYLAISKKQVLKLFFLVFTYVFGFQLAAKAQYRDLPTLGIEIKPILPSDLFAIKTPPVTYYSTTFTVTPQVSYSAGADIRLSLSRLWSLESGIYYTSRVYNVHLANDSSGISANDKMRLDNYEIPLLGLIYIRLSKNLYINNAFGASFDFFPDDIRSPGNSVFYSVIERNYWVLPALMANVGAEYRTAGNGYFYVGILYHRMLLPMAKAGFFFNSQGSPVVETANLQGHYFGLDFKYFFPTKRTPVLDNGY